MADGAWRELERVELVSVGILLPGAGFSRGSSKHVVTAHNALETRSHQGRCFVSEDSRERFVTEW